MVKVEDCSDNCSSPDTEILDKNLSLVGSSSSRPRSATIDDEKHCSSSSSGHLKSFFTGMGYSPALVDKVFKENDVDDADLILEVLIRESKPNPEASGSLVDFSSSESEDADSCIELKPDISRRTEDPRVPPASDGDKRSYLLMMNFSEAEVDWAIKRLGENSTVAELVDCIITCQTAGFSGEEDIKPSVPSNIVQDQETAETLFSVMDKTLHLLQMGFTEDEVSTAIDNYGADVSILELADAIFASRLARTAGKEEYQPIERSKVKLEPESLDHIKEESEWGYSVNGTWEVGASSSNPEFDDHEEKVTVKKAKSTVLFDDEASPSNARSKTSLASGRTGFWTESTYSKLGEPSKPKLFKVPEQKVINSCNNVRGLVSTPPYFFYGNVVEVSQETWKRLSQFLYGVEPEFVNTQFFSALARKEGYIHNLPTGERFYILPRSPMTIQEALPHTKKWWPSWDTRKQLSCVNPNSAGLPQLCQQLGWMMRDSQGMLHTEQQTKVLHQCKISNLIWVDQYKLSPIEPEHTELILGYPINHTRLWGSEPDGRINALKYSFQTDTLGYYLSVLKDKFSDGLRVLSIYTGTGGAEVALHKLGIRLKCVVSVEASEINRKIMKMWWQNTRQTGELTQIAGIERLTIHRLEEFIRHFGGFDIIIGGNPGPYVSGNANMSKSMGMDQNLYFEFVRVFQRVRSIMGRNS